VSTIIGTLPSPLTHNPLKQAHFVNFRKSHTFS
jgi:hypothetical protein